MNHSAFSNIKWLFLVIGLGLIAGAKKIAGDDALALYVVGGVFSLVAIAIFAITYLGQSKERRLRQTGQLVQADFQQVELNTALRVNGRHPFRIVAQRHDRATNALRIYRSANLWFDPSPFVQGRSIAVYVDLHDSTQYHVDLSFLPKVREL